MAKRKRRAFTKEFKAQTVRLVRDSPRCVHGQPGNLDLG
jgi:transposase-like protein